MLKKIQIAAVVLIPLLFLSERTLAQDPVLSQFYSAPMQLNPAFAGTTNSPRIGLNYRNQWSSIFNAYTTYAISYDQYFKPFKSGIGFSAMIDRAGDGIYNTGNFNLTYSYRVEVVEDVFVKGGIQAGLYQTNLNWDKLVFLDQINPLTGSTSTLSEENRPEQLSRSLFDISAGLLVYSELFYAGFSIYHINTPDDNLIPVNETLQDGLPVRVSFHGGTQISLNKDNKQKFNAFISPNIMYTRQRNFQQLNVGTHIGWGPVSVGGWYRYAFSNTDAVIMTAGVSQGIVKLGYSYDLTLSRLSSISNGTHELSLLFNLDKGKKKEIDYNDCFQLFR